MRTPIIGFAGLTHLGICSAIGAAVRGFAVVGFSEDAELVSHITAGQLPIAEPKLDSAFTLHRNRISFTSRVRDLAACDVVLVSVDVPTNHEGQCDLSTIEGMLNHIIPVLSPKATLVVLSQVPPGFTRKVDFDESRRYYQVETLIFGRALERATRPERFIVGCSDPAAALPVPYRNYLDAFGCPLLTMRYESAELAKIAINCFLVASVSTTNTLAELSESIAADWAEIAPALRLDARIGPSAYLSPGLGIAGGNLERDLATVIRLATHHGSSSGVITAYVDNSRHMRDWAYRILERVVLNTVKSPRLGILGLAYKQDTDSIKNSAALALIGQLGGATIRVHDPVVSASAAPGTVGVTTAEEVADDADAVVLMTPWAVYRDLDATEMARRMRGRIIIDPYRLLDPAAVATAGLTLFSIGRPTF